MELDDQTGIVSSRMSNVKRPREGALSHRTLERRRMLKEIQTNWLNVGINSRVQITI